MSCGLSSTPVCIFYTLSLHDALPILRRAAHLHSLLRLGHVHEIDLGNPVPVDDQIGFQRDRSLLFMRSEEHTSELQSPDQLVCRLLLEKKKPRWERSCGIRSAPV